MAEQQYVCKLLTFGGASDRAGSLQAATALLHLPLECRQHLCKLLLVLLAAGLLLIVAALPLLRCLLGLAPQRLPRCLLLLPGAAAGLCCCRCCTWGRCRPLLLVFGAAKHAEVHSGEVACGSRVGRQDSRARVSANSAGAKQQPTVSSSASGACSPEQPAATPRANKLTQHAPLVAPSGLSINTCIIPHRAPANSAAKAREARQEKPANKKQPSKRTLILLILPLLLILRHVTIECQRRRLRLPPLNLLDLPGRRAGSRAMRSHTQRTKGKRAPKRRQNHSNRAAAAAAAVQ